MRQLHLTPGIVPNPAPGTAYACDYRESKQYLIRKGQRCLLFSKWSEVWRASSVSVAADQFLSLIRREEPGDETAWTGLPIRLGHARADATGRSARRMSSGAAVHGERAPGKGVDVGFGAGQ
ncbi:hypothetical protein GCM10022245_51830 [Streptomyces mayteni]